MKTNEQEIARGMRWFAIAGVIAVTFAASLFAVDEALSNSSREQDLGRTLRELRTAQASLPVTRSLDDRIAD